MNCAFIANVADFGGLGAVFSGGGLRADDTVAVYLSSFYKNDAPNGGGGGVAFTSSLSTITNSIAWENTDLNNPGDWPQQVFGPGNGTCPTFSNVQDWDCDTCFGCPLSNICADPYFVDPDGDDNILGNKDDHLRLRLDSPSIDKGKDEDPTYVPLDSGDVDDDGNEGVPLPWDLPGRTRIFDAGVDGENGDVDQGAYEEQCPACPWDLDGSGSVGSVDLLILQVNWGARCHHANFVEPDTVGGSDLLALTTNWGDCPSCPLGGPYEENEELEAALELMGFDDLEEYHEWLRDEATDWQVEVSGMILYALLHD